ncbi:MAG: response regulator transcription factor [Clostridiales bacterium]|nr:response regulator transcription factor [Clostridiales bacterium]
MKILVVDDEPAIVDLITLNLQLEGIESVSCNNGIDAIELAKSQNPDLILLDIMMPEMDGFQVCKILQDLNIPIILLTAKNSIKDKLHGLELGADDYITKPFDSRELIARIKTVLRRVNKYSNKEETVIKAGPISINIKERKVHIDENEIFLTPKEYDLLLFFIENEKIVFSRENLLESVWGYEYMGDSRTVDIHIQRLRKKLGRYSKFIKTVFSIGYKFEVSYEA